MNEKNATREDLRLSSATVSEEGLAEIVRALQGLRFGSVHVVVQDGVIIQVDRTEKRRIRAQS